jgi:hypothetical protein
VERPAGTLEPYGCRPRAPTTDSISRWWFVEVAAALGLSLPAGAAFAIAALAGPFDFGGGPLRLAPTSSASSSVTDRLSPSGVSQGLDNVPESRFRGLDAEEGQDSGGVNPLPVNQGKWDT